MIITGNNFLRVIGLIFFGLSLSLLANAETLNSVNRNPPERRNSENSKFCSFGNNRIATNFEQAKVLFHNKQYEQAFALYQINKQLLQKLFGADDLSIAYCDANMALIRYEQKQDVSAMTLYQKAMDLTTKVVGATQKKRLQELITFGTTPSAAVLALNNEAAEAINQGNPLAAIDKLKKAMQLAPDYNLARENLSIAYNDYGLTLKSDYKLLLKQIEKSLFYCRSNDTTIENLNGCIKLIGKNPQSAKDRMELGDEALKENDPERAVVEYSEAIKIDPASMAVSHAYYVPSLLSLALYYAAKGEPDKAISFINQALKNMDQQATAEQAIIVILLKDCCRCIPIMEMLIEQKSSQSAYDAAVKEFTSLSPAVHIQYLQRLAAYYEQKGDVAQADIYYAVMVGVCKELQDNECNKNIADCLFSAAIFRNEQKRYKEAAPVLSSAIEKYLFFGWIDYDLKKYVSDIDSNIKPKWHPPKGDTTKHTIVSFRVYRDGYIENMKIIESSNNTAWDKSALTALEAANPLPSLPLGAPSPMVIRLTFGKRLSIEDFQQLKKGMSRIDLLKQMGPPAKDIGSGNYVYVYPLADGSEVRVGFNGLDQLFSIDHREK